MNLQLHILTVMPPHNVNRDEDGRPKTALLGGHLRGRISSQAKKRALRFAPHFPKSQRATRTREAGIRAFVTLREAGIGEIEAIRAAVAINVALGGGDGATQVAKSKPDAESAKKVIKEAERLAKTPAATEGEAAAPVPAGLPFEEARTQALLHVLRSGQGLVVSTVELAAVDRRIGELARAYGEAPKDFAKVLDAWIGEVQQGLLTNDAIDLDTALFGRMVAADPDFNVEAAASVAHAVTTHAFAVEGDYFSAGEELNVLKETGAAITSYAFFGSGVYYQHAALDLGILTTNLERGRPAEAAAGLVPAAVDQLLHGLVFAQPKGKRNSFASDVAAGYIIADLGDDPALNLATAFLEPVKPGNDLMLRSIDALQGFHDAVRGAYGLAGAALVFNAYPPAWGEDAPGTRKPPPANEFRTWESFRTAVLAGLGLGRA